MYKITQLPPIEISKCKLRNVQLKLEDFIVHGVRGMAENIYFYYLKLIRLQREKKTPNFEKNIECFSNRSS